MAKGAKGSRGAKQPTFKSRYDKAAEYGPFSDAEDSEFRELKKKKRWTPSDTTAWNRLTNGRTQ